MTLPPSWLRMLIHSSLPTEDRVELLGELDTLYANRLAKRGRLSATLWYARQAFGFLRRLGPLSGTGSMQSVPGEFRTAWRFLSRRPGYSAAFILTLGVGGGVLSTAYAAANWVLLRPVPGVRAPDSLVTLRLGSTIAPPHVAFSVSHPDLVTLRQRLTDLSELAAVTAMDVDVRRDGATPIRIAGEMVTSNYFRTLGTRFAAGRGFAPSDDVTARGDNVVVVSDVFARRWTSRPESLVGATITVNGARFMVTGVTERGFRGATLPGRAELWFPLSALTVLDPSADPQAAIDRSNGLWPMMIGRLAGGSTTDVIVRDANGVMDIVRAEFSGKGHSYMANHFTFQAFRGVGLNPTVRDSVRRTLALVGLTGAFLMLLAIANLANLTLTQSSAREGSMAIRAALGADRRRLARNTLIETLILGLGGSVAALLLSLLWSRWFEDAQLAERGGSLSGLRLDWRVIAVTITLTLGAALTASLRQMFALKRIGIGQLLRRTTSKAAPSARAQMSLVTVQVALSLTLVVAAGLLGGTVVRLRAIDLGFQPQGLFSFALEPHLHGYEHQSLESLAMRLETELGQSPRIVSAGFISPAPMRSDYITGSLATSGARDAEAVVGAGYFVTVGFFETIGITVLAGEGRWRADSGSVVITRAMQEKLFPAMSVAAVPGQVVYARGKQLRIAAVIENLQLSDITGAPVPTLFQPMQDRYSGMSFSGFVRERGRGEPVVAAVHRAVSTVAPELSIFEAVTSRELIDRQFAERRIMALAASTLGVLGVILAVIGLYGVLGGVVAARQREIGIRMALGATTSQVRTQVLISGLRPTVTGVAAGMLGALLMSRLLKASLYGVGEYDLAVYLWNGMEWNGMEWNGMEWNGIIAIGGLLSLAFLTSLLPAWRATKIAPASVMRSE